MSFSSDKRGKFPPPFFPSLFSFFLSFLPLSSLRSPPKRSLLPPPAAQEASCRSRAHAGKGARGAHPRRRRGCTDGRTEGDPGAPNARAPSLSRSAGADSPSLPMGATLTVPAAEHEPRSPGGRGAGPPRPRPLICIASPLPPRGASANGRSRRRCRGGEATPPVVSIAPPRNPGRPGGKLPRSPPRGLGVLTQTRSRLCSSTRRRRCSLGPPRAGITGEGGVDTRRPPRWGTQLSPRSAQRLSSLPHSPEPAGTSGSATCKGGRALPPAPGPSRRVLPQRQAADPDCPKPGMPRGRQPLLRGRPAGSAPCPSPGGEAASRSGIILSANTAGNTRVAGRVLGPVNFPAANPQIPAEPPPLAPVPAPFRAAVRCFAAKAHHFRTQRKSYFFFPLGSPIRFLGKIII